MEPLRTDSSSSQAASVLTCFCRPLLAIHIVSKKVAALGQPKVHTPLILSFVFKLNFLNFYQISRKERQDLWYQISIIRYTLEYIFIICLFYVIDVVTLLYKASQT